MNDAVTVDDTGEARLRFADYLVVNIYRDSDLRIEGLADPGAPPAYRLRLEGGSVNNTLNPQQLADQRVRAEVRIYTKWAVIRALGTTFFVHYDRSREMTWVVVKRGAVTVTAAGVEVTVQAGQQTWVEPGEAPLDPLPACRDVVGDLFPLVNELTNEAIPDEYLLLCPEEAEPTAIPAPTRTRTPVPTGTRTPTPTGTRISTPTGTTTPRPTWTPTPTGTGTPTPTRTRTPAPTVTRTPTPTDTPWPTPFVSFYANPNVVPLCDCTTVHWDVENIREVYFQGRGVADHDSEEVCTDRPGTTTYELRVVYRDGRSETFTADVVGMDEPASSLRDSVRDMLVSYDYYCQYEPSSCPDEVLILHPGFAPYRCVAEQAIRRSIQKITSYTRTTVQEISTSDLRSGLITRLQAGTVPSVVILVYPSTTMGSLGDVIDGWPYYQYLYTWDEPSDALKLLQYRTPSLPAAPSGLSYQRIGCNTIRYSKSHIQNYG